VPLGAGSPTVVAFCGGDYRCRSARSDDVVVQGHVHHGGHRDSGGEVPAHVVAAVRRRPPGGAPVVPGSTPVVAFGDPSRAEVATLGINPSRAEFIQHGSLLRGKERRLSTFESLGAGALTCLSTVQVAEIVADCSAYFEHNPYRRWFDPLDALLRAATDTSYYDATACHLDLVQWATDPVWGKIADRTVRQALLDDGVPHLRAQLARENVRLVLLNGRQVIEQVMHAGLADLIEVGNIPFAHSRCRLFAAAGEGVRWIGWSTNLQSSWGVSAAFKGELARRIAELTTAPPTTDATRGSVAADIDGPGHLRHGLRVTSKRQLVDTLAKWLSRSSASSVGDVASFGGRPWLRIEVAGHEIGLNADTKRAAIETFVHDSAPDPERPWRVVANTRGRVNKVLPNPTGNPLPGWYAYLTHPLPAPATL